MALDDTFNITRPGQQGATGDIDKLHLEEYTGVVEATIARKSVLEGFVPMRTVKGTSVITNFGVGESALQKVVAGQTPDGTVNKFGKNTLTIDTLVLARSAFPLLETWQTSYDSRKEVGMEHGKKIAKFRDQSFFIQAIKTARLADTAITGLSGSGHFGGNVQVLANAADANDPALLYKAIADLFVKMENKDVDPRMEDVVIAVRPDKFYLLLENEQLINTQYKTSEGVSVDAMVLKTYGVPVVSSNNFPAGQTITSHLLSNADNGNAYDGDFSKVVVSAFSPRALLAGATIPLTTKVHWSDERLQWLVDAYLSYGVGPNRAEFAGTIELP
jgi:RNA binding exosome subunit